jgi:hypothetical protein
VLWANPHVVITLETEDSGTYVVEWRDLRRLTREGIADGSLKAGERIVVTGSRHRNPDRNVVTLLTEVRRIGDDWTWSRPASVNPPKLCTV